MTLAPIQAAAEHFIATGCITLTDQQKLAKFALAAIPVIEALPVGHGTLEVEPLIFQCNGLIDEFTSMKTMEAYRMTDSARSLIVKALESYAALAAIEGE